MTDDKLIEDAITVFNGGQVKRPSATNPRGYVIMYQPKQAMVEVISIIRAAERKAVLAEVAGWLRNEVKVAQIARIKVPLSELHADRIERDEIK